MTYTETSSLRKYGINLPKSTYMKSFCCVMLQGAEDPYYYAFQTIIPGLDYLYIIIIGSNCYNLYLSRSKSKECNNSNHGSSCSDKQDSSSNDDDHKHSSDDGSRVKKDKTPFVLAQPMPFP